MSESIRPGDTALGDRGGCSLSGSIGGGADGRGENTEIGARFADRPPRDGDILAQEFANRIGERRDRAHGGDIGNGAAGTAGVRKSGQAGRLVEPEATGQAHDLGRAARHHEQFSRRGGGAAPR